MGTSGLSWGPFRSSLGLRGFETRRSDSHKFDSKPTLLNLRQYLGPRKLGPSWLQLRSELGPS
jgi:hypothetical protein